MGLLLLLKQEKGSDPPNLRNCKVSLHIPPSLQRTSSSEHNACRLAACRRTHSVSPVTHSTAVFALGLDPELQITGVKFIEGGMFDCAYRLALKTLHFRAWIQFRPTIRLTDSFRRSSKQLVGWNRTRTTALSAIDSHPRRASSSRLKPVPGGRFQQLQHTFACFNKALHLSLPHSHHRKQHGGTAASERPVSDQVEARRTCKSSFLLSSVTAFTISFEPLPRPFWKLYIQELI